MPSMVCDKDFIIIIRLMQYLKYQQRHVIENPTIFIRSIVQNSCLLRQSDESQPK